MPAIPAAIMCLLAGASMALAAAKVQCDRSSYNFGDIPGGTALRHVFLVSNVGDAPLSLKIGRACCGAKASLSKTSLAPGDTAEVSVEWVPRGRTGAVSKAIYLATSDPDALQFQLRLKGNIVGGGSFTPSRPAFPGDDHAGSPRDADAIEVFPPEIVVPETFFGAGVDRMVRLQARGGRSFRITSVVLRGLEGRAVPSPSGDEAWGIRLYGIRPLEHAGTVLVSVKTSHPGCPRLDIPVRITKKQRVAAGEPIPMRSNFTGNRHEK